MPNVLCFPYQPLEKLSASLFAVDLHIVVMGDKYVGIVRPCKIYNVLAANRAFLYIGSAENHSGGIVRQAGTGHTLPRKVLNNAEQLVRRRLPNWQTLVEGVAHSANDLCDRTEQGQESPSPTQTLSSVQGAVSSWNPLCRPAGGQINKC